MSTFPEGTTTIADFTENAIASEEEPGTQVRGKKLSGGATMWQARLVLSTLDPAGAWATKLRLAIRQGDEKEADGLLDAIYARNSSPTQAPQAAPVSMIAPAPDAASVHTDAACSHATVLPPSPHTSGRVA